MATPDPSASEPVRPGWRGRRAAAEQRSAVQHGWQRRGPDHPHERLRKQKVRTRTKVLLCLLGGAVLAAALLAMLFFWPRQTPVVYIAPADYQWPLPPQAMVHEDLDALMQLDRQARRNEGDSAAGGSGVDTLQLIDISKDWDHSRRSGLARFQQELGKLARDWTNSGPIVVYLCMHGVSDERGRAYLVPPDASPTDVNTWLEFEQLLAAIDEAGREHRSLRTRPKLLILDCSRMDRNWRMGLIRNRFTEGVQEAIRNSRIPNLAVLNSVSQDEQAWVSQVWQASVFGYFLREGLSGKASPGDRKVTVRELESYLRTEVDQWARRNRGARQQPKLWMTEGTRDFAVAYAGRARRTATVQPRASETIQVQLPELWRNYHAMRETRVPIQSASPAGDPSAARDQALPPTQSAVLAWHRLEHQLCWLQQLAYAGRAYEGRAEEVRQQIQRAQDAYARSRDQKTPPFSFWNEFDEISRSLREPRVHSIPLCRQFGLPDEQSAALSQFERDWGAAWSEPTRQRMSQAVESLRQAVNEQGLPELIEGHLPELVSRYGSEAIAGRGVATGRLMQLRMRAEALAAPLDHRVVAWLREPTYRADQLRRVAEDLLFIDEGLDDQRLKDAEAAYDEAEQWRDTLHDAYAVRDRCWAELPYYALWFTRPDPAILPSAGDQVQVDLAKIGDRDSSSRLSAEEPQFVTLDGPRVVASLANLIQNARRLGQRLAEESPGSVSRATLQSDVAALQRDLHLVQRRYHLDCQLLQESILTSPDAMEDIERVLSLPLALAHATQRSELQVLLDDQRQRAAGSSGQDAVADAGGRNGSQASEPAGEDRTANAIAAADSDGTTDTTAASEPKASAWEALWSGQREHPALMILELVAAEDLSREADESDAPSGAATLAESGESGESGESNAAVGLAESGENASSLDSRERRLRGRLRNLLSVLNRVYAGNPADGDASSRAEQILRTAAPLVDLGRGTLDNNPVDRLRRRNLQQLLIWHGQRALNDVSPRGLAVAAEYREAATLVDALPDEVARHYDQLAASVARFGSRGLRIDVESLLLPVTEGTGQANVRATVQRNPASASAGFERVSLDARDASSTGASPDSRFIPFPPSVDNARAALFARDSRLQLVSQRTWPVPLPLAADSLDVDLAVATGNLDRPTLEAVLMFRGFEFTDEFLPERIGGFRVAYEPQVYDRSSVTLQGQGGKRLSVMFVLDCSQSMREPIEGEQQSDPRPRMEIAKSKLQEMLRQLARERDVRVGAIFLGHRRGWSRTEPFQALTQERYAGADLEALETLQPGEDVEVVLKLGRFDRLLAEQVIDKLERVQGWGQTPLYRSLVAAEESFAADDPDTDKRIIVITDGRNFEYAPPNNPLGSLDQPPDVDQVIESWQQHGAKIHIVSLALQDANVPEVEREFRELARETNGSYVAARNASSLIRQLQSLLGAGEYELLDEQGRAAGFRPSGTPGPVPLGQMLLVRPTPDVRTPYVLQYRDLDPRVDVQPGDALELEVSRDGQVITAVPFNENGLAEEIGLVEGENGAPAPLVLRVHPPLADTEQNKVLFRVSVQMRNLSTTPRPAEAWVEVTPLAGDQATAGKPTYFFYDANFLANQPVPVLAWEAGDWPFEQARYAQVRFWCKPEPTPVPEDGRVVLRDLLENPDAYATLRELGGLAPGVSVRIEARRTATSFRVDVIEVHRGPDPDMDALKLRMQVDPNAPLRQVTRQFDKEHGIAVHSFVFPGSAEAAFRRSDQAQLHFLPGPLVKDGAWQLPAGERVVVPIANDDATLQVGPALR